MIFVMLEADLPQMSNIVRNLGINKKYFVMF